MFIFLDAGRAGAHFKEKATEERSMGSWAPFKKGTNVTVSELPNKNIS